MKAGVLALALQFVLGLLFAAAARGEERDAREAKAFAPAGQREPSTFLKDAGWCWFQDPRVLIKNGLLVIGGVSGRSGDVKVGVYDLKAGKDLGTVVLHEKFQRDDHDAPALFARPDGRLLAVYARHNSDKVHHYRISAPGDYLHWGPEREFTHAYPQAGNVTYMNLHLMAREGRLYNFFRGIRFNPSFVTSTNFGDTWSEPTHFIADGIPNRGLQRPYARYVQRDENSIGVSFTEAHPRNFGTSIYYAEFRDGAFHRADGSRIKELAAGPLLPSEAERIFQGSGIFTDGKTAANAPRAAWTSSIAVDAAGHPHIAYSVYLSNDDHRFRLASWNGRRWIDREVAFGGRCLYPEEASYTGLITLDPSDPARVFVSTDVDPGTGKDRGSSHEVYTARIGEPDDIRTIHWQPVTSGSKERNIRPIIAAGEGWKMLLWLSGPWRTFRDYESDVVGLILERP